MENIVTNTDTTDAKDISYADAVTAALTELTQAPVSEVLKNAEVPAALETAGVEVDEAALDAALAAQEEVTAVEDKVIATYDKREPVLWEHFVKIIDELHDKIRAIEQRIEDHNTRSGHKI